MVEPMEAPLDYEAGGESYRGLVLRGRQADPLAAVVLLPDWRGQSALARDHANHLVELGCVVAIADLYGGGFNPDSPEQVGPMVKRLLDNRRTGAAALASCVAALKACLPQEVPLFCLGYSAGGMIALDYGRSGARIAGIIVCSALLRTAEPGQPTRIEPPVLMLQGTRDQVSPMNVVAELVAEMDAAGNDFELVLFGQTHHAFDNPEAGTDPTARLVYSPKSAEAARRAMAGFIRRHAGG